MNPRLTPPMCKASIEGGITTGNKIDMCRLLWEQKLEGKPNKAGGPTFTSQLYQYNTLSFVLDTHQAQGRYDDRQSEVPTPTITLETK